MLKHPDLTARYPAFCAPSKTFRATCGPPRKPASLLYNTGQHPRWEPSWEPSALDCCDQLWTHMDMEAFRSRLCGRLWTARDAAWRSADQKVVGSSPAGRAADTLAREAVARTLNRYVAWPSQDLLPGTCHRWWPLGRANLHSCDSLHRKDFHGCAFRRCHLAGQPLGAILPIGLHLSGDHRGTSLAQFVPD